MSVSPAELQTALQEKLCALTHSDVRVENLKILAGGASQEMWRLDLHIAEHETRGDYQLVLRRQLGGKIYRDALDLAREFRVMQIAYASNVLLPYPQAFLTDLLSRPAALVHRKEGETIGRRIVREPALEDARKRLPAQMGEMLARIHRIDIDKYAMRLFLPQPSVEYSPARWEIFQTERNLDEIGEPHPALELGLRWLRRNEPPAPRNLSFLHGDYRIGNVMVNQEGLVSVLDWEFAHIGDPYQDLTWSLVRDWRFGNDHLHFGGIAQPEEFFAAYEHAMNTTIDRARVHYWEVMGNVRWAVGMLNQAQRHLRGEEPNLEFASLGRRCAEIELEVLRLI
jgi:aminoglycoside phosphotransferase (APT) family kinase protein